ncbi:MAG: O-antigen ligase family protein [Lentisphaeria bacterium]|nr:O-antigen ligase family protein [Lentisphaeria bacterium]
MKTWLTRVDHTLMWGSLLALAISPTQYGFRLAGNMNVCLVDPLIWGLGGLLGLRLLVSREWAVIKKPPVFAGLFFVFCAVSLVVSQSRMNGIKELIQYAEYFLVAPALFLHVLAMPRGRRWSLLVFAVATSAVIGFGLTQYLRLETVAAFAVGGSFGNANVLGGFLSLVLPLALSFALSADRPWWPRLWGAALFLAGLFSLLSGGALVAVLTASIALVCLWRTKTAWVALAAVTALLMFIFPLLPRQNLWTAHDSIAVFTPDGEPAMRYPEWQAAAAMIADRPLTGVGLGAYQSHVGQYAGVIPDENVKAEADSQNMYLVLASTIGIPGVLCFALLLAMGVARGVREFIEGGQLNHAAYKLGAAMALLAFAVNCVWSPLLVRGIGIPLAFILALAYFLPVGGQKNVSPSCESGKTQ